MGQRNDTSTAPVFVSYVMGGDLMSTVQEFARPDIINLAFGAVGHNASVKAKDITIGFTESGTKFSKADVNALQRQGSKILASIGGSIAARILLRLSPSLCLSLRSHRRKLLLDPCRRDEEQEG